MLELLIGECKVISIGRFVTIAAIPQGVADIGTLLVGRH